MITDAQCGDADSMFIVFCIVNGKIRKYGVMLNAEDMILLYVLEVLL